MGKVATEPTLVGIGRDVAAILENLGGISTQTLDGTVYGFHIDGSESDPYSCVSYTAGAVGMKPAYMDFFNGAFNWGDWGDAFFLPRPCMLKYDGTVDYYLDPNNYGLKDDGETPSDVADTTYGGNAMMEWGRDGKKIWYCIIPRGITSADVYIADHRVNGRFHAWPFVNANGEYVDHFYTPIYNGSNISSVLRSMSGQAPMKSQTATTERTYARANYSSLAIWDTEVYCDIVLINLLLILISKSLDSQAVFGKGLSEDGSESANSGFRTGVHDTKGLFWGTPNGKTSSTTYENAVKIFGMENWWGFQWRRFGGLVNDNGTIRYKMTRGTMDGSIATDYVISTSSSDYSGKYITGPSVPSASGSYIKTMNWDEHQFTPREVSGSQLTYYADGLWTNNSQVDYAYRGGASNNGSLYGAFALSLNYAASASGWDIGAAPSCKPLS